MTDVILNAAQREALSWFFNPDNQEGEPFIEGGAIEFRVERGIAFVCGAYLWPDGEWGSYHPDPPRRRSKLSEDQRQALRAYNGLRSAKELANQYGVSESYVRLLRTQAVKEVDR